MISFKIQNMKNQSINQRGPQISRHLVVVTGSTLQGSGPNYLIYNCAKKWKQFGYRVTIICQDRKAYEMKAVDSYIQGQFLPETPKLNNGELRVVVPNINGVIPIYSSQQFQLVENIKVKSVQQMTDEQIQTNINMTAKCLRAVCQNDRPYKVLANFVLLSPIITTRAIGDLGIPFDMTAIGAAIIFSIKPYPRLTKWVIPGLKKTNRIYQLTQFVQKQFIKCFKDSVQQLDLQKKFRIFMPGMDTKSFNIPISFNQCQKQFIEFIKQNVKQNYQKRQKIIKRHSLDIQKLTNTQDIHKILGQQSKKYSLNAIQQDFLQNWIPYSEQDQTILYVGAILNSKGMGELLAIAPKLIQKRPTLKFIFCGTGPYLEHMRQLIKAYQDVDLKRAKIIAQAGDFITQVNIQDHFIQIDKKIRSRIIFAGLINQKGIAKLMPLCTLYAATSRVFKPCSMLIVEAMCCGMIPVCNDHSWLTQVLNIIQKQYPQLTSVARVPQDQFFQKLPQIIIKTLDFIKENKLKINIREKIRQIAVKNFSWEETAKVLAEEC